MKELLKQFFAERGFFIDFENYTDPGDAIKNGEKIIGEMNDFEKSLYSFLVLKEKEHDELMKKMESAMEDSDCESLNKLKLEHKKIDQVIDLAGKMMWSSLELRLETSEESTSIAIRKEFKVVECFHKRPLGVEGMFPGIMVVTMTGH